VNPNQPPHGAPPPFPPQGQPPFNPHGAPPVPRDYDDASFSEMVPFVSRKIKLWRSPLVWLAVAAALISAFLLFVPATILGPGVTRSQRLDYFTQFAFMAILFFVLAIQLVAYLYARPNRSIFFYMWSFAFTALILWIPYAAEPFFFVFRSIVPGTNVDQLGANAGFFATFWAMFWGAGLMEELLKAVPILIGAAVAISIQRQQVPPSPVKRWFEIRGPLDGVLMGIFAGGGFILIETATQYVPNAVMNTFSDTGDLAASFMSGLFLLVSRVIRSLAGHMGYAALFGYFIGLAVIRRKRSVQLILIGWLASAFIHGIWNSLGSLSSSNVPHYIWAAFSALLGAAALLKARQLHRSMHPDAPETHGSIVIDRSGAGQAKPYVPPVAPPPAFPSAASSPPVPFAGYAPPSAAPPFPGHAPSPVPFPGYAQPPAPFGGQPQQPFAGYASNAQPAPPAAPVQPEPEDAAQQPVMLAIAGQWIALDAGVVVDLGVIPALAGRGAGMRGDVVAHPSRPGVLGLRNSGGWPWTAYLRDGTTQHIDREQNIRLAPGVRIDFGGGVIGDVVARG